MKSKGDCPKCKDGILEHTGTSNGKFTYKCRSCGFEC